MRPIYVDHNATTPLREEVLEAMLPYLREHFGNASSLHSFGIRAREAIEEARAKVAQALGCEPREVIFTGSGTEADNQAIKGVAFANRKKSDHIITSRIEHHAVLHTCQYLEKQGFKVTYLPVDEYGMVDPDDVRKAITDRTILISIMHANNEVGTIEPVAELARLVKARDPHIIVHTDAVQTAGSLNISVDDLGVDMLSIAAHKVYGPKGVGALYVRARTPFLAQMLGGSQEKNRRAGTEDVAGAVGLATALRLAYEELEARNAHCRTLRDRLLAEIPRRVPGTHITGPTDPDRRLPNNFSCCFEQVEGEAVLIQLDLMGIAASSGSACTTASLEPSHVLTAMGISEETARGSLRVTVGKDNTMEEIEYLLEVIPEVVGRLRALSPLTPPPAGSS